jgi:hypothetical protein
MGPFLVLLSVVVITTTPKKKIAEKESPAKETAPANDTLQKSI